VYCEYPWGFRLDVGFIEHLYTQLVSRSNYSSIADFHTLQITRTTAKSFPACCGFTGRSLVTASNLEDSSVSVLKSSLKGGSLPTLFQRLQLTLFDTDFRTELTWLPPVFFLITPRHGPRLQHRSFSYANRFRGNMFAAPSNGLLKPLY
jgi:hypothetical protein